MKLKSPNYNVNITSPLISKLSDTPDYRNIYRYYLDKYKGNSRRSYKVRLKKFYVGKVLEFHKSNGQEYLMKLSGHLPLTEYDNFIRDFSKTYLYQEVLRLIVEITSQKYFSKVTIDPDFYVDTEVSNSNLEIIIESGLKSSVKSDSTNIFKLFIFKNDTYR